MMAPGSRLLEIGVDDEYVRGLDPLGADRAMFSLRAMNAAADLPRLIVALRALLPSVERANAYSLPECLAAMRDIGMFLGSIKRRGCEPVEVAPGLEEVLVTLACRTGMIPRDTVHHYIRWNPRGSRERMYTGDRMEHLLMLSVRNSLPSVMVAIGLCRRLAELEPDDLRFTALANELVGSLRAMEDAIDTVLANVSPEFFALTMRPYFEEIRVAGRTYLGPAAAHVPLSLVDLKLWASDNSTDEHREFLRESVHYGVPQWRELYRDWPREPSLVTRLLGAGRRSEQDGELPADLAASAEALCRALRSLVVFRGKHLSIARKAYAEDVRLYPLGSGGGSIDLLEQIVALTKDNSETLRRSVMQRRPKRVSA